jgi:hypothetical protein
MQHGAARHANYRLGILQKARRGAGLLGVMLVEQAGLLMKVGEIALLAPHSCSW